MLRFLVMMLTIERNKVWNKQVFAFTGSSSAPPPLEANVLIVSTLLTFIANISGSFVLLQIYALLPPPPLPPPLSPSLVFILRKSELLAYGSIGNCKLHLQHCLPFHVLHIHIIKRISVDEDRPNCMLLSYFILPSINQSLLGIAKLFTP